jgi:hypothetical protein
MMVHRGGPAPDFIAPTSDVDTASCKKNREARG